jgi:hypothetical protein
MANKTSIIKTIFAIDGERKLEDALKGITSEQKELRSEMSRATAAYKLHGNELRYNQERADILSRQYEVQKKKVDELRHAVELASEKYDENSTEMQELRTRLSYAEGDLMKLQKQMEEATAKASKFGQSMLDAGEKITNAGQKMKNAGDKMTKAITLPVVALATAGVKTVAEMEAVNAQFEQVFGEFGNTAQKEIDRLSDEFGMLPNRIKPPFTKLTSQFKGLGADTEAAMSKAADATTLAADAAAFFDKSMEDAQGNLNSFIKGNYEGGEAIGLFAKETQLAEWSAKNLGLEWKKLGEMDKQFARLSYAQAMYDASGATGQAAREADQFENQLGNLKQAAKDTLAELAAPLLEPTIDVMKTLGGVLQDVAEWFGSLSDAQQEFVVKAVLIGAASGPVLSGIGRVTEGIGGIVTTIGKLTTDAEIAGNALSMMGKVGIAGGIAVAVGAIYTIVSSLTEVDPAVKRAQESLESLDDEFRDMEAGYLAQTELIKQYRGDLDTLMQEEDKSVATKRRIQSVVERLNQLVPELNLAYDEQADKLNMAVTEMDKLILSSREAVKEQLKQELVTKLLEEEGKQLEDLIKYQIELEELSQSRQAIEGARNAALMTGLTEEQLKYAEMTKEAREYHGVTLDLTDEQVMAVGKLKKVIEEEADRLERATGRKVTNFVASTNALNELDGATRRTQKSSDELAGIYEGMGPRMEEYEKALDKTLDSVLGLKDTQDDLGDATEDSAERQTEAIKKMAEETIPVWEQLGMSQEEYEKAVDDHAKKIEDRTAENVKRLSNFSDQKIDYEKITVKKFIELKQKELEAFTKYEDNLSTVSKRTSKEFADELRKMGDAAAPLIAKIATASDKELEELETVFKNRTKAATDAAKEELGQLPGVAENYVNSMIDAVDRKDEELKKAGYRIGSSLVGGTKRSVLMDSPSKVGIEIGENWDDSIAMGAEKALPRVKDAGRKVGDTLSAATLPTPQDLSMQLDVIRRVSTVGDYGAPVRVPVGGGVVGQPGTASVPALGASPVFNINVQVPYDESEDFGRRVGRMVMNELHSAEMSRGG